MKVSIIIPAYNEEKRIRKTLESYLDYFNSVEKSSKKQFKYNILVVINNTTDNTEKIVSSFKDKHISNINLKNGGKGYAVINGFKSALEEKSPPDLIGFVDADMATTPEEYHKLIKNIGNLDGIIASRYLRNSRVYPKPTFKRILASRCFNFIINSLLFLGYKDTQCGAKLFKSSALKKAIPHITYSRWAFDVDLLYSFKIQHLRVREFPTVWSDKDYSKINFFSSSIWMFLGVIRIRLKNSPFRFLVGAYDVLPNKIWNIKNGKNNNK